MSTEDEATIDVVGQTVTDLEVMEISELVNLLFDATWSSPTSGCVRPTLEEVDVPDSGVRYLRRDDSVCFQLTDDCLHINASYVLMAPIENISIQSVCIDNADQKQPKESKLTDNKSKAKLQPGAIQPLYDKILVIRDDSKDKTEGGLLIPENAKEKSLTGIVNAVGEGRVSEDGFLTPLRIKEGDKVLFGKYAGTEVVYDDVTYVLMSEHEVLAVIKDSPQNVLDSNQPIDGSELLLESSEEE